MNHSEIYARFSAEVAEALIAACLDNPAWNKARVQAANCKKAHKYYVLTSEVTEGIEEHTAEQQLKLMMDLTRLDRS